MNWKTAFLILFITPHIISCATEQEKSNSEKQESESQPTSTETFQNEVISEDVIAEEFNQLIAEKPGIILDVRTAEEYEEGHINNALNIDFYGDNFANELENLDKNQPIYVYCHSGGRSGKTKKMLVDQGFICVYNLSGGFSKWHP